MTRLGLVTLSALSLATAACASSKTPPPAPTPPVIATPIPAPPTPPEKNSKLANLMQYRTWITEARVKHPYPEAEQRMYDVMMCESGGKADIVNKAGPYTGLFQYSTPTWKGAWNAYKDGGITDAKSQIFATAQAWEKKMQNQWGCYKKTK